MVRREIYLSSLSRESRVEIIPTKYFIQDFYAEVEQPTKALLNPI